MDSDCTHLFVIDSDLGWETAGFTRVIKAALAGFDVIGGTFPNKNKWSSFGVVPVSDKEGNFYGIEKDGFRLIEVMVLPGGFLIYTKNAFEMTHDLINRYTDTGRESEGILYYEYFRCDINDRNERMGEDCYFMNKFRQAGGKVFLEPDITFTHFGVKGWRGNYHNQLLDEKQRREKLNA